ncbi:MAG: heparan-alpha-glucosaminide N-acetyltransferase domain-containing protein [Ginsengibacter sp.]
MQQSLTKQRFYSLDVFRGATVCLMILVNNPGSWSHIYTPLEHAPWHGVTPTDLVFPFFLFAVGNALAFVMPRLEVAGPSIFWKKVIKRTLLIFLIGLALNWMPFVKWQNGSIVLKPWSYVNKAGELAGIRILGVLQRIALAYFFATALIYLLKIRGAFVAACVILLGYWFLTVAGNPADPYSLTGWFGTNVDKAVLGAQHMYHGESLDGHPIAFDPEGLMSLFGSIVQVMFGYFVGDYIIKRGKTAEMINGLFVGGIVFLFAGYMWDMVFPLNKKIWTSSYTVFTTGMAMVIIATMIYLIELKNKRGWLSKFFDVFGKNPLFIFVLSGVLPRVLGLIRIPSGIGADGDINYLDPFGWFYEHICRPIFPNNLNNGSLLYALCMITFYWLIVFWMDKKKIYIKV